MRDPYLPESHGLPLQAYDVAEFSSRKRPSALPYAISLAIAAAIGGEAVWLFLAGRLG